MKMNKIAIRILIRMLDTLIEQTYEVKYYHEHLPHAVASGALRDAHNSLRVAKLILATLVETHD